MKQFFLFIFCFTGSAISFAQEFTSPDSAAIIKNHVKNVKIYYTGTGTKHLISGEMRFNKKGQLIYASDGLAPYYNSFTYYENGKTESIVRRNTQGKMMHGTRLEYDKEGRISKFYDYPQYDTAHPSSIYYYDSLRNITRQDLLTNGIITRVIFQQYDFDKNIIYKVDSAPGRYVFETTRSKTIRQTYYNEKNEITESWTITYDKNGVLETTTSTIGNKTQLYSVKFDRDYQPEVTVNGNKLSKEEFVKWDYKFHYLYPRPAEQDFGLPYSDPNAHPVYIHTLKRDKAGNIIEDVITRGESWIKEEPVKYEYEYEYW